MMKKLIILVFILTTTLSISQNNNSFEWPKDAVTPVFKDFLKHTMLMILKHFLLLQKNTIQQRKPKDGLFIGQRFLQNMVS